MKKNLPKTLKGLIGFVKKIPEPCWTTGSAGLKGNSIGQHCILGHLGMRQFSDPEVKKAQDYLGPLGLDYANLYMVNDDSGERALYSGYSPKTRVLSYLTGVLQRELDKRKRK